MDKIIKYENLRHFAYVNDRVCQRPIRGIVLSFSGLGGMGMIEDENDSGRLYGENGILFVEPYNNPWSWMNRQAVGYTDEIVDVLFDHFALPANTPIVSTGLSMGGLASIIYCLRAKRTPIACVANCPVCDLVFHYDERPDLPRTLYSALWNEVGSLEEALKNGSPLHLADQLPLIPYHVFHCTNDQLVDKERHSDRLVEALRLRGRTVTYTVIPGRGHCDLGEDGWEAFRKSPLDNINNFYK